MNGVDTTMLEAENSSAGHETFDRGTVIMNTIDVWVLSATALFCKQMLKSVKQVAEHRGGGQALAAAKGIGCLLFATLGAYYVGLRTFGKIHIMDYNEEQEDRQQRRRKRTVPDGTVLRAGAEPTERGVETTSWGVVAETPTTTNTTTAT